MTKILTHHIKPVKKMVGTTMVDGTPTSMPSVAETSQVSSNDDDDYDHDHDDVVRQLFINDEVIVGKEIDNVVQDIQTKRKQSVEGISSSEVSIASSDETAVASWNLSPKSTFETICEGRGKESKDLLSKVTVLLADTKEQNHQQQHQQQQEQLDNTENNKNEIWNEGMQSQQEPTFMEEPPEDVPPSCNSALRLTPKQLTEIFLAFDGARKMWPSSLRKNTDEPEVQPEEAKASSTSTSSTLSWIAASNSHIEAAPNESACLSTVPESKKDEWKQRAEKFERECQELKKIIRGDSFRLLKLTKDLEAHRELHSQKYLILENKEIELHKTKQFAEKLNKERDVYRERESELLDTISILKDEIDKATQSRESSNLSDNSTQCNKTTAFADTIVPAELEQMRFDNQLFASQIVEYEVAIAELRSALATKETENMRLRREIESLQKKVELINERSLESNETVANNSPTKSLADMGEIMKAISVRLETMERQRYLVEQTLRDELKKKENDIDEIRLFIKKESDRSDAHISTVDQGHDEIEVLLQLEKETDNSIYSGRQSESHDKCCCDENICYPWVGISGDLAG